jgi:hypothetical protein
MKANQAFSNIDVYPGGQSPHANIGVDVTIGTTPLASAKVVHLYYSFVGKGGPYTDVPMTSTGATSTGEGWFGTIPQTNTTLTVWFYLQLEHFDGVTAQSDYYSNFGNNFSYTTIP